MGLSWKWGIPVYRYTKSSNVQFNENQTEKKPENGISPLKIRH
jgi:hypothetical protein